MSTRFVFLPLGFVEYPAIPRKSTIAGANGDDHGQDSLHGQRA
jgi:hypothetical protein